MLSAEQFQFVVGPGKDTELAMRSAPTLSTATPTSTTGLSSLITTASSTAAPPFFGRLEPLKSQQRVRMGMESHLPNGSTFGRYGWMGYGGMGGNRGNGYERMGTCYGGYVSLGTVEWVMTAMEWAWEEELLLYALDASGRPVPNLSQSVEYLREPLQYPPDLLRRCSELLQWRTLSSGSVSYAMPSGMDSYLSASHTGIEPEARFIVPLIAIFDTLYAITKLIVEASLNARQHQDLPVPGALPPLRFISNNIRMVPPPLHAPIALIDLTCPFVPPRGRRPTIGRLRVVVRLEFLVGTNSAEVVVLGEPHQLALMMFHSNSMHVLSTMLTTTLSALPL
ncbi:hypothetical protein V5O48_009607 [Marasmius crinis-equi]|uniref:Uncharacterized protein n=1 Tax=Marasmius crinis-equi TaxID=585013 RepID=A0ABR3FAS8_9AGAR